MKNHIAGQYRPQSGGNMLRRHLLIVVLIASLTMSCAVNPVTGKKELMLYSEAGEIELGRQTDEAVSTQYGIYDDPALTEYVKHVGMSMVSHTHRPHLTYHFSVLDTPVVNAFAAPGGFIYVTRGALAVMRSEAELATILGHELGHVNARHSVRKMSTLILVQVGLAVGSALSDTFADISGLAGVGIQLLFLKFSRDDERQADTLGVEYSRSGGYNPGKMVDFFSALQRMGDLSGGHSLPGFLSTHPLTEERIQNTRGMLTQTDGQLRINKNGFLNSLDHMVYGTDPRQGFIESGTFYHPLMRFSFTVPPDWKVQNQRSQVILISPDENAAVILQAEESADDLHVYARNKAANLKGATFISDQDLRINGLSSYQQLYEISQENQANLKMRISYIRKNKFIYAFNSFSTEENYGTYDFQFGTIVGSFRELTSSRYLNRKPLTLKIIRADGRKPLKTYLREARIRQDQWPMFAIMNGMDLDDVPGKNTLIKVL